MSDQYSKSSLLTDVVNGLILFTLEATTVPSVHCCGATVGVWLKEKRLFFCMYVLEFQQVDCPSETIFHSQNNYTSFYTFLPCPVKTT